MPGTRRSPQLIVLGLSAALCLFLAVCYAVRPEACAAVTVLPVWLWLAPGVVLTALGWRKRRWPPAALVGVAWLVFLLACAGETDSLLRLRPWPSPAWETAHARGQALRVITLNCAGGQPAAVREVAAYHPDLVLLQESPRRQEVERLAAELFGAQAGVVCGPEASLIARGQVTPARRRLRSANAFYTRAHVRFVTGQELEVVSLRLLPPVFRADLWSPACWHEQRAVVQIHRRQLRKVMADLRDLPAGTPLLIGGDFNAPAGDPSFRELRPHLRDAFVHAGQGWGNTIIDDFPFHRIDQLWTTPHLQPAAVVARPVQHSDHWMVVGDLTWR